MSYTLAGVSNSARYALLGFDRHENDGEMYHKPALAGDRENVHILYEVFSPLLNVYKKQLAERVISTSGDYAIVDDLLAKLYATAVADPSTPFGRVIGMLRQRAYLHLIACKGNPIDPDYVEMTKHALEHVERFASLTLDTTSAEFGAGNRALRVAAECFRRVLTEAEYSDPLLQICAIFLMADFCGRFSNNIGSSDDME